LTLAETAVAALVVDGRTNREIAQQLFISPHTVNAHLRHIFDKMGVRSRVELTRRRPAATGDLAPLSRSCCSSP